MATRQSRGLDPDRVLWQGGEGVGEIEVQVSRAVAIRRNLQKGLIEVGTVLYAFEVKISQTPATGSTKQARFTRTCINGSGRHGIRSGLLRPCQALQLVAKL